MNFPQPFQGCPMSVGEIDSVEVKAMLFGRVLVIDEFDKAPTEVVLTLKGLLHLGTEREIFEHDVNESNHKEDMESMETLPKIYELICLREPVSFYDMTLWLCLAALGMKPPCMLLQEVQEQERTTRLRPCQGVSSEICPVSICHCCI